MTTGTGVLRRTPLYDQHLAGGAKLVPFAGWHMPLHYGSQIEEHMATRQATGIFDVSHMGQIVVRGTDALELLQRILARDISNLRPGRQSYCVMCRQDGGLIDDLFAACLDEHQYMLVVNAATYGNVVNHIESLTDPYAFSDARVEPVIEHWAMIAVQGPRAHQMLEPVIGSGPWQTQRRFRMKPHPFQNDQIFFSSTGYTGEPGGEILCPPHLAEPIWRGLVEQGARPVGLAARDSLRLEMGLCLSGQDFTSDHNPFEAGIGWTVHVDKSTPFCGQAALREALDRGIHRRLVCLQPEGRRIPRHGAPVLLEGHQVGEITSGSFSPYLKRPIAMGYVPAERAKPGNSFEIDLGRGHTTAAVVQAPFLKQD